MASKIKTVRVHRIEISALYFVDCRDCHIRALFGQLAKLTIPIRNLLMQKSIFQRNGRGFLATCIFTKQSRDFRLSRLRLALPSLQLLLDPRNLEEVMPKMEVG